MDVAPISPPRRAGLVIYPAQVLGLAGVYYLAARLGQLAAIEPGNVTAFWAPSGIALAALYHLGVRVWPGVWLGSFAFNAGFFLFEPEFGAGHVPTAAVMASGAALQAIASTLLVRRSLCERDPLGRGRDFAIFVALAGPVGCLIAPTIGVTSLAVGGVVPWPRYWATWWTWWFGDAAGVVFVAPMLLVLAAQTRRPGAARVVGVAGIAGTLALWQGTRAAHDRDVAHAFRMEADGLVNRLAREVDYAEQFLYSVRSFVIGSERIEREEFRAFTGPLLDRRPSLRAVSWNPLVPASRRAAFEEASRSEGLADFRISERDEQMRVVTAGLRDVYAPVHYLEPREGNESALGYDLLSDPARREAIELARDSGMPAVTHQVRLVQARGNMGVLLILPVHSGSATPGHRGDLLGFTVGVLEIDRIVEKAFAGVDREGIDLTLFDDSAPPDHDHLYTFVSPKRFRAADSRTVAERHRELGRDSYSRAIAMGGQTWRAVLSPTDAFRASRRSSLPLSVLISGLLLSGLLTRYLALLSDRDAGARLANLQLTAEVAQRRHVEHRLRDLYDHLPDLYLSIDAQTRTIADCNRTLLERLGLRYEEVVGQPASLIFRPDSRPGAADLLQGFYRTGRIDDHPMMLCRKDGAVLDVMLNATALRDATGRVVRGRFVWRDVTQLKRAREDLEQHRRRLEETIRIRTAQAAQANAELAEKNERLTALYETAHRFVDNVSHEFRTPLTVIKGYTNVMLKGVGGSLTSEHNDWLKLVNDRTRDLTQMVDDLLDTSKLRAGMLRVDRRAVTIPAIIDRVWPMLLEKAAANKVFLDLRLAEGLPAAYADAEKAGRVLVNLVVNAIKFTAEGGTAVVWAEHRAGDGEVEIGVTDTGPGIGEVNLRVIFERFRQVGDPQRSSTKGFGLGLNIAKELVALNLGRLDGVSKLGRGSTFSFTLPVDEPRSIVQHYTRCLSDYRAGGSGVAIVEASGPDWAGHEGDLCAALAARGNPLDLVLPSGAAGSVRILRVCEDPNQAAADWSEAWGAAAADYPAGKAPPALHFRLLHTIPYGPGPERADRVEAILGALSDEP